MSGPGTELISHSMMVGESSLNNLSSSSGETSTSNASSEASSTRRSMEGSVSKYIPLDGPAVIADGVPGLRVTELRCCSIHSLEWNWSASADLAAVDHHTRLPLFFATAAWPFRASTLICVVASAHSIRSLTLAEALYNSPCPVISWMCLTCLGVRVDRGLPEAAMLQHLQIHNQKHQYISIIHPNLDFYLHFRQKY